MGLPGAPDWSTMMLPVNVSPFLKSTLSPGVKTDIMELSLEIVCQAVLELKPLLLSFPVDEDM